MGSAPSLVGDNHSTLLVEHVTALTRLRRPMQARQPACLCWKTLDQYGQTLRPPRCHPVPVPASSRRTPSLQLGSVLVRLVTTLVMNVGASTRNFEIDGTVT